MNDGLIGDVYHARGLCYKWRNTIGRAPVAPVPAGVHYDQWLGPAPLHAFTKTASITTGIGFGLRQRRLRNQGIHELDIARWGLGVNYPTKIAATGGHFMFDDDQETPNMLAVGYEFNEGGKKRMLTFEVRGWATNFEDKIGIDRKATPAASAISSTAARATCASSGTTNIGRTSLTAKIGNPGPSGPPAETTGPILLKLSGQTIPISAMRQLKKAQNRHC